MTLLSWRKSGGISKKRKGTKSRAVYVNDHKQQVAEPQLPTPVKHFQPAQQQQHAEQQQGAWAKPLPASKPSSTFRKIITMPVKALFARRGAEVHDSAGLDEAVAYYVSATLHSEDGFWSGHQDQAQHLWG